MNRRKLNRITLLLLVLGFGSALWVYLTADRSPVSQLLNDPLANKRYRRELRVMGGQANVLAADFEGWFDGLWHGESLALTIAVLTVGTTLGFRFVALRSGSDVISGEEKIPPPNAD